MGPHHFEKLIETLFSSQGYHLMARNQYDGEGGDIDLVFSAYAPNTLMGDAFECSDEGAVPQIRIQAKKKKGEDKEDCEGINQLIKFDDHNSAINIVISTAEKFSEKARSLARDNGVFLINGRSFAQLLIKYGCQLRFDVD